MSNIFIEPTPEQMEQYQKDLDKLKESVIKFLEPFEDKNLGMAILLHRKIQLMKIHAEEVVTLRKKLNELTGEDKLNVLFNQFGEPVKTNGETVV